MSTMIRTMLGCLLIGATTYINAQDATDAAGGNASGPGGKVSYSIGEVAYTTNKDSGGTMTQGVQQPYEISIVTTIQKAEGIKLFYSVYPNPAMALVTLRIENYKSEDLAFQLFDVTGKLLESRKITGSETTVQFEKMAAAVYLLKVADLNKEIKTFKIIKN